MKNILVTFIALVCSAQLFAVDVTFYLDMNGVAVDFTTPEVNGTFNAWCGSCAPMTDDNADGIWELTIDLAAGQYEYKFSADEWNEQETLVPGSSCTVTSGAFTNRIVYVEADPIVLPTVCWSQCTACGEGPTVSNVTFRVDMSEVTDGFTTPEVNGTFNAWCGGCAPMSDEDLDGVWELTITISGETAEFKYAADTWNIQESLTVGSSCTITTDGFTNRYLELSGDVVLPIVCWSSCASCTTDIEDESSASNGKIYPNPASEMIRFSDFDSRIKSLEIYSLEGKRQISFTNLEMNGTIDVSALPAGMFLVKVETESGSSVQSLIIE